MPHEESARQDVYSKPSHSSPSPACSPPPTPPNAIIPDNQIASRVRVRCRTICLAVLQCEGGGKNTAQLEVGRGDAVRDHGAVRHVPLGSSGQRASVLCWRY